MKYPQLLGSAKQMKALKARFNSFKENGYPGLDAQLLPVMEELADTPGVVPVWSCEGHPIGSRENRDVYIMFVVNQTGYDFVMKVYTALSTLMYSARCPSALVPYKLTVNHTHRVYPIGNYEVETLQIPYPVMILRYNELRTRIEQIYFLRELTRAIKQLKQRQVKTA